MVNEKFLIFIDAADDAMCMPASQLLGMTCAGDGVVILSFTNTLGPNASEDKRTIATLTCTADTEKTVFTAIAQAINGQRNTDDGVLVVCDDVNSVFLHANILSCTITLDA